MIENEFVPYVPSLALKELGFDEPCLMYIDDEEDLINDNTAEWIGAIKCPLYQQAFRWFREIYNIEGQVKSWKEKGGIIWHYSIQKIGEPSIFRSIDCAVPTYDEAQLICLQQLIQIVKNEKPTHITNR